MHPLKNTIRGYAWGSPTLMSDYLGRAASGQPEAEMWLGAHPGAPSIAVSDHQETRLDELVARDPAGLLGAASRQAFGDGLPFLMKLLAAGSPLSLQVHPTREQAARGFADEDAKGIPRNAPHRNYKDSNHKPEMIVALTDFAALCGFRPPHESAQIFGLLAAALPQTQPQAFAFLNKLHGTLRGATSSADSAVRTTFARLIQGGPDVTESVDAVAELLARGIPQSPLAMELATALELNRAYPGDPGVLISLMLNRVTLRPGEAVYLPAGNIHAYLHGLGIEVMASSDNVLRGGLTTKHVDTAELLRIIDFQPLPVPLIEASVPQPGLQVWEPPFDEFQLQRIVLTPGQRSIQLPQESPVIVLVVSGGAVLTSVNQWLPLERGESVFIGAQEPRVSIQANGTEPLVAFVTTLARSVTVPVASAS